MSEQKHFTQEQAQAMYAALQYVANEPPRFGHNIPLRIQLVARDTLQAIDSAADAPAQDKRYEIVHVYSEYYIWDNHKSYCIPRGTSREEAQAEADRLNGLSGGGA